MLCGGGAFEMPWDTYLQSVQDVAEAVSSSKCRPTTCPVTDCDADCKTFAPLAACVPIPQILDTVDVSPRLRLALANVYHDMPRTTTESGSMSWTAPWGRRHSKPSPMEAL